MKHAYLIIAHNQIDQLKRLICALDYSENDLFIHIDKKSRMTPDDFSQMITTCGLFFIPRIKVTWGGYSQVECELNLLRAAYERNENYGYYHLLSGVDFPVKSHEYISDFFQKHKGENFLRIRCSEKQSKIQMRCDQYHLLQNLLVGKNRNIWKYLDFFSCYLQRCVGIRRFGGKAIRYGSNWWSITSELASYFVSSYDTLIRKYRWTYCADECFCITEVLSSSFADTLSDLGDLRFVEWVWYSRHDSSPRVLKLSDMQKLSSSEILFARKFILPDSLQLEQAIEKNFSQN
jgi:hypothetical protein